MATVLDLITDSLREIGAIATNETASADDAAHCLSALNRLVDQWAAERLMIHETRRTTWAIVSGTASYTIGSGATINILRPVWIDRVSFTDSAGGSTAGETPLTPLTEDGWGLMNRNLTAANPSFFFYNPASANGTIYLFPKPTSSTLTGIVYAPYPVVEFTSYSATVSLPPGYRRCIVKNLAVEICPSFERQAQPELVAAAVESKAVVKRANKRLADLYIDAGALAQGHRYAYDINTGP